ncbi:MAG: TIGR03643 family protein [Crocinitomicaceae bacterium]|nr:TIGR03643 family protein [Crocinitomicaceae bacterium]|tara:strand:- start:5362 stop:5637 length:276 start_codon:yes stop_codon:yes gene_type:complete
MNNLSEQEIDRVIEMAWEDRTPFEAISYQFGLEEEEVIQLMRNNLKEKSWKRWRKRVQGRKTKHLKLRSKEVNRHKSSRQKHISGNRISKR